MFWNKNKKFYKYDGIKMIDVLILYKMDIKQLNKR